MVRILIVEDQRIMQKYFESIIMREPEFRHVQTVSDACEAVSYTHLIWKVRLENRLAHYMNGWAPSGICWKIQSF